MIGGEWKRAGGDRQSPLLVRGLLPVAALLPLSTEAV